ncbi:MAG: tetratricopeptide repeat protein [Oligoflexia bacterium]|nr:tetratricopeptide repeat protein [Oligoflexia bacterium]
MRFFSLLLISLALISCASQKPRGKVVRIGLEPESSSTQEKVLVLSDETLNTAESKTEVSVPEGEEEAAIFHFSLGQAYSLDNDPLRAVESFRAALVHDENSPVIRARLAAELVKIGKMAEAKEICEKSIAINPKYVDSYLLLAGIQVAAKEYDAAIASYQSVLKYEPESRDALLYLGVTFAEIGKMPLAVQNLEKLVKLKDSDESPIDKSVAYFYLAKVHVEAGAEKAAIAAIQKAIEYRPGFSKAAIMLSELWMKQQQEKKAIDVLVNSFKENHSTEVAEKLSEYYLAKADYKKAIIYLETLVEDDPQNENLKLKLSLVYWQIGWKEKARSLMSQLLERFPDSSEIAFYLGEISFELGKVEESLAYYKRINPEYTKYEQMVGRVVQVYRSINDHQGAEAFLRTALNKRQDLVALYPLLAATYEDRKDFIQAQKVLEQGLEKFPGDENILYYLGFLYDRMGNKTKSITLMRSLLASNPMNTNALNFLGYSLLESGKVDEAEKYLVTVYQLKPDDPYVLDSYGWMRFRQGKKKEAMKALEKAYAKKPEEVVIAEHLGDVYLALAMPKKALEIYSAAMKTGSDDEAKARIEAKIQNISTEYSVKPAKQAYQERNIQPRTPASK